MLMASFTTSDQHSSPHSTPFFTWARTSSVIASSGIFISLAHPMTSSLVRTKTVSLSAILASSFSNKFPVNSWEYLLSLVVARTVQPSNRTSIKYATAGDVPAIVLPRKTAIGHRHSLPLSKQKRRGGRSHVGFTLKVLPDGERLPLKKTKRGESKPSPLLRGCVRASVQFRLKLYGYRFFCLALPLRLLGWVRQAHHRFGDCFGFGYRFGCLGGLGGGRVGLSRRRV